MLKAKISAGLFGLLSLSGCGQEAPEVQRAPEPIPVDPIAQMEIAFEGNPSQREIKPALDRAMKLTKTTLTAESYSRAGSALVALRQTNQINEMDILKCMPHRMHDTRVAEHTFVTVAAVCATDLSTGDYP